MTYSLGFRAPSQRDLAADWFQHLVSLTDMRRLLDPPDLRLDPAGCPKARVKTARLLDPLPSTRSTDYELWQRTSDRAEAADFNCCRLTKPGRAGP